MAGLQFFWEKNVFRLDLNESREGFYQRGRGRSFHADGPKTEKAREPPVECLVRGIWRLRISEAEQRVREGVRQQPQEQRCLFLSACAVFSVS